MLLNKDKRKKNEKNEKWMVKFFKKQNTPRKKNKQTKSNKIDKI